MLWPGKKTYQAHKEACQLTLAVSLCVLMTSELPWTCTEFNDDNMNRTEQLARKLLAYELAPMIHSLKHQILSFYTTHVTFSPMIHGLQDQILSFYTACVTFSDPQRLLLSFLILEALDN